MKKFRKSVGSVAAVSFSIGQLWASPVPKLPIEAFFGQDDIRDVQLSPDGTKVAMLAPNHGTYSLAVLDLDARKVVVPVHFEDESIRGFVWKGNDHLVFYGFYQGFEVPLVASTDIDGKKVQRILGPQMTRLYLPSDAGTLVSTLPWDPTRIAIRAAEQGGQMDIFLVNVSTTARTRMCPAQINRRGWVFDHSDYPRAALQVDGSRVSFIYRELGQNPWLNWKVVGSYPADGVGWLPLAFAGDDHGIYIEDSTGSEFGTVRVLDPDDTVMPSEILFAPTNGEIAGLLMAPPAYSRLLAVYHEEEKRGTQWLDGDFSAIQEKLDRSFPDHLNEITGISDDRQRILIHSYSDQDPGRYFVLDRKKGSLGLITPQRPSINPAMMAKMLPISYAARDGLTIHGYLTLPPGSSGQDLPLIIHPHGGPFGIRDHWGFDPEVQFLANRGYAVLQVNFRGSGGYGGRFAHAGFREWGGKMLDDMNDGVHWAIAKRYADPKRIAIFGASYGGYAALAGVTFTPDLYKCAINYVGVSDLVELTRRKYPVEDPVARLFFDETAGADRKFLESHSPVNFVDRIRVPTLHAYGENDPRVSMAHWTELKHQLDKYKKPYEFMIARDEGHGFFHTADAVEFYARVESFLARNL